MSLGIFTFLFYALLFIFQLILYRGKFTKRDWLQVPLSVVFSVFIDVCVPLVEFINPSNYLIKMGFLLLGCVFRSLGVSMQITADVAMLSGEAFMVALSKVSKIEFSIIKFIVDAVMVTTAVSLSFVFFGKLIGIREGTLISVVIIAPVTRYFNEKLLPYRSHFQFEMGAYAIKKLNKNTDQGFIVTISSQSGSGGHKIAKLLSKKLDLPIYDDELVDIVAKEGGFAPEYVRDHIEKMYTNRFLEFFSERYSFFSSSNQSNINAESFEPLFKAQHNAIEKLAKNGSCIIVGHCSEYILANRDNVFSVYIHANEEAKLNFITKEYNVDKKKAMDIMHTHDHDRAVYFKHFTGEEWDSSTRYSLSIDSSILGIEDTAMAVCDVIKRRL